MSHVGDDLTVLRGDLGVLDQLVQVLLRNAWTHLKKKKKKKICSGMEGNSWFIT